MVDIPLSADLIGLLSSMVFLQPQIMNYSKYKFKKELYKLIKVIDCITLYTFD